MTKKLLLITAALLLTVGASCGSSATKNINVTNVAAQNGTPVVIANQAFSQSNLTVAKGTTVTWTNNDAMAHTVTGDNGGPSSETLSQGQTYSYTFDTTGTFAYHCAVHPFMKATVTVTQ